MRKHQLCRYPAGSVAIELTAKMIQESIAIVLTVIDRYIIKLFLGYFLAGLTVFATLFLAVDFMGAFSRYEVSSGVLVSYYVYYLPEILYQMVPVACLVATVFTLANLNKHHELTALFSFGMSLARVSVPILALVALISVLMFFMGDRLIPRFAQKKNYVYYVEIRDKPSLYSTVKTNRIWYRSENVLFNIQTLNPTTQRAQGLTLYYFDAAWNLVQLIKAKEVHLQGEKWRLESGTVTLFAEESSFPLTKEFSAKVINMGEDLADLQSAPQSSDIMSIAQLKKFIENNKAAGLDTLRYEVDYHGKFSFGFAGFVMALLGIPFSIGRQRSGGNFLNVALCVGFAVVYWLLYSSSITLGRHGSVPPTLAAWGPNVLVLVTSVFLLLRLKR